MLNAVLFDLDNTLIDRDGAFRAAMEPVFPDAGVRTELMRLDDHGYGRREVLFSTWQQHGGGVMDQPACGRMIASHIQVDEALIEALRLLGHTKKLGIITNGGATTQRMKYQAAGLSAVIVPQNVWVSEEVGRAKPDPDIFRHACQMLGEPPENCLYVGDHAQIDFAGARQAGLRARLVDKVLDARSLAGLIAEESSR
jgi:putative hydrolase of the HAD superfamily